MPNTATAVKIKIETDACIMCETCIGVCPVNNFKIRGTSSFALDDCYEITCNKCAHECPEGAISLI